MHSEYKSFIKCLFCKYILPAHGLPFEEQRLLMAMNSNLPIFYTFCVLFEKPLPKLRSLKFAHIFSSTNIIVWLLCFRSVIHFELFFVYAVRCKGWGLFFGTWYLIFWHHLLIRSSFPHCISLAPLLIISWLYTWTLHPIPIDHMSSLALVPHSLGHRSPWAGLAIRTY